MEKSGGLERTVDGVDVGTADTAGVNGNVNVTLLEGLELELLLLEVLPLLLILDHEALGGLWVRHVGGGVCVCVCEFVG